MSPVRVYGKAAPQPAEGSPLLAGLLVSIVIVVGWVGLAYMTHHAGGVAACGVGCLLGMVVDKVAKPPTKATGALAAVLTLVTALLAKVVLVVAALQPMIRQELANDPGTLTGLFLIEKIQHKSFSPQLQATIDTRPDLVSDSTFFGPGHELREQMVEEAGAAAKASSFAERDRLLHVRLYTVIDKLGFWVLLLSTLVMLDVLWNWL